MYSQTNDNNSSDRLSVADILSSMANGTDEPSTTLGGIDGITCGIPTRTTPTLTPTTLKNIEESFMELQSIPPAPIEHQHQAGFVPPIVTFTGLPLKQEDPQWMDDCMQSSDRSMESPGPTSQAPRTAKTGRNGGRRPNKDEKLSPEEEERRRVRRERNKLAAARCRKRRMDHTNSLLDETSGLEEKRRNLQNEIHDLSCQKEQLEFILEAHKATCKLSNQQNSTAKPRPLHEKMHPNKMKPYSRPNTLSLSSSFNTSEGTGNLKSNNNGLMDSTLNTPSAGMYFESLIEEEETTGQSGLSLVISSCSSQQRSSSSDLSSPDSVAPPKLVSL